MAGSKQIPREAWSDYCTTFTNGNNARSVSIEILGEGAGTLVDGAPLLSVDFDPVGKGNDILVSTGSPDEISFAHKIGAPTELWESHDDDGRVTALEIVDQNGGKIVIGLRDVAP